MKGNGKDWKGKKQKKQNKTEITYTNAFNPFCIPTYQIEKSSKSLKAHGSGISDVKYAAL